MTAEPLEEAEATSRPVYDLPNASVGNEADDNSSESPGESQSQDFLPDDVPPVGITAAFSEHEDVDQASETTAVAAENDEDQLTIEADTFMGQDEDRAPVQSATSMEQYVDQVSVQMATLTGQDEDQASMQTATSKGQDEDQASMQTATSKGQDEDQASMQTATSKGQDEDQVSMPITPPMGQDGNQASMQIATSIGKDVEIVNSMNMPTSGDKDENPDAPSQNQENLEGNSSLLPQDPGILQVFVGFQNPVWDRLAENNRTSRSRTVFPSDSQNQEKTPGKLHDPEGEPEIAPKAEVPSALPENVQPSVGATDPSTLNTSNPDQEPKGITKSAEQEAEGFGALNPESKDRPPGPTREDLADESRIPQTPPPFSSSPGGSPPPSPGPCHASLGRNLLDPSLYRPDVENDYMRSMTSLLGGGEGSISSLADILVWSDTATGMGVAVGILTSGYSSPADRLHEEGPSLRTVSSLLGSARSALSSGLVAGTGSALRSVTHLLESVERRTVEGIRSAVRYLANHFTSRWAHAGPNSD
ncbi:hypothetical protein LTLLF_180645 [Microtus ochrogaster]|uniref:Testis-expressed protein 44 n=1 Tax=Microtus ochrogaster TaxID=79684 RepID=A0A8J6G4I8_MICOH|nr:hypothetical protein LTLLF_180645 [Microtus ochrogaster]